MSNKYNASGKGRKHDMHNANPDEINSNALNMHDVFTSHLNYLLNLASNLHTFYGLPLNPDTGKSVRSSFFEQILIYCGEGCIARTQEFGLIVSPCTIVGKLNIYGEPVKLKLTPSAGSSAWCGTFGSGINMEVDKGDFVYFRNDNLASSLYPLVYETAKQLSVALFAMNQNIGQQVFPVIVKGTRDTSFTIKHIIEQVKGFASYILIKDNNGFDITQSHVMNTDIPYVADKVYKSYMDILNNFFMRLGINVIPNEKKERMLVDEVNANNQGIRSISDVYLNNRIEACEIANNVFPELKDLRVERNNDFIESLKNMSAEEHISSALGGDYDAMS